MTDKKKTKQQLIKENQTLREAIRLRSNIAEIESIESQMIASAMDAIITIDEAQNIVQFNAAAESIFGYEAQEMIGKSIHELLPEHFRKSHHKHIQSFRETGSTLRHTRDLGTLTGLRANGEVFPLEISISSVSTDGKKFHFAIIRDVSERVKLEGLLVRQYDFLNSLHQMTLDLLNQRNIQELLQFIVDEAEKILETSFCEILLPEDDELVARAYTRNTPFPVGNRLTKNNAPLSWKVFETGMPATVEDYSAWEPRNEMYEKQHLRAAAAIPILVGGECIGVLGFARVKHGNRFTEEDILSATRFAAIAALAMENSRLYREIEMLATTDELTGIHNRRSLMELGEREVNRSFRYHRQFSMLMLDADHFKHINDTWGHPAGDMVLRGIAQQCTSQIRVTDTVGRYAKKNEETENIIGRFGGEEFVILLPETPLDRALIVAERIRSSIEKMEFTVAGEGLQDPTVVHVTVSIGASSLEFENDSLNNLLVRADHALYTAKKTGRNRVCVQEKTT